MYKLTLPLIQGTGALLTFSATAVLAAVFKYGSTVLDTILDVDNYLRTSPLSSTPRARIAERVTSLLRFVANYKDDNGRGYDRLIVVAHSLGALVTGDLLRFLKSTSKVLPSGHLDNNLFCFGFQHGAQSSALPIYLFTMGDPLRQLLNRFFPHLYEWVAAAPDNSSPQTALKDALPKPDKMRCQSRIPPIAANALPDPAGMSVKGWCNAYRSGDYVGRFLWLGPWLTRSQFNDYTAPVEIVTDGPGGSRAEMCIGIGAHTHYWERIAPDVAHTLDALITDPVRIFK